VTRQLAETATRTVTAIRNGIVYFKEVQIRNDRSARPSGRQAHVGIAGVTARSAAALLGLLLLWA
jgi:hypothetical protein